MMLEFDEYVTSVLLECFETGHRLHTHRLTHTDTHTNVCMCECTTVYFVIARLSC